MTDVATRYRDKHGEWRWHRKDAENGRIVAASTESYENEADCIENYLAVSGPDSPMLRKEPEEEE
jgi:hypothetical protein